MIGRRAAVGLSLLCALVFCAFAAPSAFAAKGTTAFTCEPAETGAQFADEHCDTPKAGGSGWKHKEIPVSTPTEFTVTNAKTANATNSSTVAVLHAELFHVKVTIECTIVSGTGSLENKPNNVFEPMSVIDDATVEFTNCIVAELEKCTVKAPIIVKVKSKTFQNATEEGIEFSPTEGTEFVTIVLEGAECAVKGSFKVTGGVKGTPGSSSGGEASPNKGATLGFTEGMSNLKLGGEEASFTGVLTLRMKGTGGNPITLTTTAN